MFNELSTIFSTIFEFKIFIFEFETKIPPPKPIEWLLEIIDFEIESSVSPPTHIPPPF